MNPITYRQEIEPSDLDAILNIVQSSGFFSAAEIELACELAADKLEHGRQSSYQFLFAEDGGQVVGYTCYGLIPATAGSYDLYWIAVSEAMRGRGLGKILLQKTEAAHLAHMGGKAYLRGNIFPRSIYADSPLL
ncbi:MAG: GNAT family N-acetyltransferase [Desulfosudis oleivorans]|nr:GNAT family N-acetyltransferase [Desulfosudis oleivorans]